MGAAGQLLVGLAMLVGLVGVLLPVLPGLLLIGAAGLVWTIDDGGGTTRWLVFAAMCVLFVVGTATKYILPARSAAARGAPTRSLLVGALGAVVGFFLIPVVGAIIGGVVGIYLAELARLADAGRATASTKAALVAVGIGMLVELAAGISMIGTWLLGLLLT